MIYFYMILSLKRISSNLDDDMIIIIIITMFYKLRNGNIERLVLLKVTNIGGSTTFWNNSEFVVLKVFMLTLPFISWSQWCWSKEKEESITFSW